MQPPVSSANVNPVRPAGPAADAMKPRPGDTPQAGTTQDVKRAADASPAAAPSRSDALQPSPPNREPGPIRPMPAPAAMSEQALGTAGGAEALARPGFTGFPEGPGAAPPAETVAARPPPAAFEDAAGVARTRPDAFEAEAVAARQTPAETAALKQATEGYAQLGSYASIQWKLNISA